MKGKCAVCGKEGEVFVACSTCGAISFAYCEDCLNIGAEPYGALVEYISCAGDSPEDITLEAEHILIATGSYPAVPPIPMPMKI